MPNITYKGAGRKVGTASSAKPGLGAASKLAGDPNVARPGALPAGIKDAQADHDLADMAKGRTYPSRRGPEWLRARREAELSRRGY